MDSQMIRSYLWADIIRLGFCPVNQRERKKWLHHLFGSLRDFWEISEYQEGPSCKEENLFGRVDNSQLNLWLEFELRVNDWLHVAFNHLDGNIFYHHSDPDYFTFPLEMILDSNQRSIAHARFDNTDIQAVLDSCFFHPREHLHIKSPIDLHAIRIGGGLPNSFLYLFHLRYQLCPIIKKREAEKRRLLNLFADAIRSNAPISVNKLMEQPENS